VLCHQVESIVTTRNVLIANTMMRFNLVACLSTIQTMFRSSCANTVHEIELFRLFYVVEFRQKIFFSRFHFFAVVTA